jgi:GNAT superfamily N-acetyltransferase
MMHMASTDDQIQNCFETMKQLRPNLQESRFVDTVRNMMIEGYRLAYAIDGDLVVCVAGFRIAHNLFMGKHLYVEDLVTSAQARSQGVGSAMMGWLITYGKAENCTVVHLDSGYPASCRPQVLLEPGYEHRLLPFRSRYCPVDLRLYFS